MSLLQIASHECQLASCDSSGLSVVSYPAAPPTRGKEHLVAIDTKPDPEYVISVAYEPLLLYVMHMGPCLRISADYGCM